MEGMVGLILTAVFCLLTMLAFRGLLDRWVGELDDQEAFGVSGLIGVGVVGTLAVAIGLIPGMLKPGTVLIGAVVVAGAAWKGSKFWRSAFESAKPQGMGLFGAAGFGLMMLFPLVAGLAPSTTMDWDSLAYHLAVPKMWLAANQVGYVQTIHHSNFPFALDGLYLFGLQWGGESGAKAFMFFVLLFGARSLYGLARRWGAGDHSIWAPLALAGSPVVLWESGTAYIDVGHGLFTGLGVLYAAEIVARLRKEEAVGSLPILAGLTWGLALGTKLTGLQTFFAAGLVFVLFGMKKSSAMVRPIVLIGGLAFGISAIWFVKSAVLTGNPVFPFFYEQLGGKGWDQWRADIYRNEQQTFGVGQIEGEKSKNWSQFGHAVLGLAYQPGRYVNPGQTAGAGFPTGAIGFAALFILVAWTTSARLKDREKYVLGWVILTMVMWFALSQQSRYLTFLVVPAAVLAGVGARQLKSGAIVMGAVTIQALATLYILVNMGFADQLKVVTGGTTPDSYRNQGIPFYPMAEVINANTEVTEVALFDEVFGYLLDKKYFWANPGHSDRIKFELIADGVGFADELKKQGVSHVYLSMAFNDQATTIKWLNLAGMGPGLGLPPDAYSTEEIAAMDTNREVNWKLRIADAVRLGRLTVASEPINPRGLLFKVN